MLNDSEWGQWSDREIARRCKVHHSTVAKIRQNLTGGLASDNHRNYKDKHGNLSKMDTTKIGKTDPENAETDKLSHTPEHQEPLPNPESNNNQLKLNQLVQLELSSFDGVSENLKLLNHSYGIINSQIGVGKGYNVKFFGKDSSLITKTEDLKPVEQVSLTLTFEAKEYIALMNIYGDRRELFDAIKQLLTGVKPK